jgi:DNA mismatch repair protein MLH1
VVNIGELTRHLFHQLTLLNFGNADVIQLNPPADIKEMTLLALDHPDAGWTESDGDKEDLANGVVSLLVDKKDMLDDYFSIQIDDQGQMLGIPMLLEGYIPDLNQLPMFVLRVATNVDWEDEESCFDTFSKELALFYRVHKISDSSYDVHQHEVEEENDQTKSRWKKVMEHTVFPAIKKYLKPPKECADNRTFNMVADLPELYKVFERC